jgi:uncharacterized membrane protein YdfJ with MMPL/SSD domain
MGFSTRTLAVWSARHAWRTVAAWVALMIVAAVAVGGLLGGSLRSSGQPTDNPQSQRARDEIKRAFPAASSAATTDLVVVRSARYSVGGAQFRALTDTLVGQLRAADGVRAVGSYDRGGALVSRDRHAALIRLSMPTFNSTGIKQVVSAVKRADSSPGFSAVVTGEQTRQHDFNQLSRQDLSAGELRIGLPAALIVLLLVFGTAVAGVVPLALGVVSIVVGLGVVAALAQAFSLSVFVINMLTGMGLALGIDYSLFVISRYREERAGGREKLEAIAAAGGSACQAVVFSGTTFVVAMFGLFLVPSSIIRSLAVGAIVVGVVSVVAAVTLLPALISLLGDRLERLRLPFVRRRAPGPGNPESRVWGAVVGAVLHRPLLTLAATVIVLLGIASPVLGLHVGTSGVNALPASFESRQGLIALERSFPNATATPVQIAVTRAAESAVSRALSGLRARLAADTRFGNGTIQRSSGAEIAVLTVPMRAEASSPAAVSAVRDLRATIVPQAFSGTATKALVGGRAAENVDYFDSVTGPAPWVIAFVLGLSLILLTAAFRAPVIAFVTVVLNLLSVGAAYGLLVLVFQHGVGSGFFGFQRAPTIEAWVPLFLFSVLFGLSMDYQVFLLSRIRERHDQVGDTEDSIRFGVVATARIITGAALIIVAVFTGFASGRLIMFQQMGFGIAAALLIDATIIRSLLFPAAMRLLGPWNWYLPRRLAWLPRVEIEAQRGVAVPVVEE